MSVQPLLAACDRSPASGDPGGMLLAQLRAAMTAALPPGADTSGVIEREPYRDSCDGRAGTAGWTPATVATRFATGLTEADLAASIDQRLASLGWHRARTQVTAEGSYLRWEKPLATGTALFVVNSAEQPHPDPDRPWDVVASAPPDGQDSQRLLDDSDVQRTRRSG